MRTFKNNPGLYITATLMIIAGIFLLYKDNIIIKGSTRLRGHVVRTYYKKTDVSIGSERYHRPIMVNVEYKDVMYRTPDGEYRTITLRAKDVKNDSSVDVLYNPSIGSSRAKGSKSGYKYLAISCLIFGGFLWFIVLTSKDEDPSVKEKEDEEKYLEFKKKAGRRK